MAFADELEVVAGLDEKMDTPVINENFRKKDVEIKAIDTRVTTAEADITTAESDIDTLQANQVFTKSYTSAAQTITAAGSLTLAHGMGIMPKLIQVRLVCTSTDVGYSAADEVIVNPHDTSGSGNDKGISIVPDATNLNIRFGNAAATFSILNKGTGSTGAIDNSKWTMVIKAWA